MIDSDSLRCISIIMIVILYLSAQNQIIFWHTYCLKLRMENLPPFILFVDDERSVLNALLRELRAWETDARVTLVATEGAEKALLFLERNAGNTALIVSDMNMPGMRGTEFLESVHRLYTAPSLLLLTAHAEIPELASAVSSGISSLILKPWTQENLVAELAKALASYQKRVKDTICIDFLKEDLARAGELQKAIIVPRLPEDPRIKVDLTWKPLENLHCGGDFVELLELDADCLVVMMGDVSSHGVRAALVVSMLKAVIYPEYFAGRTFAAFSPAAFMGWLNDRVTYEFRSAGNVVISFVAAMLDRKTGTLLYANAGHPLPVIHNAGGVVELDLTGPCLGMDPHQQYQEGMYTMNDLDTLMLYTDGLVEHRNPLGHVAIHATELVSQLAQMRRHHDAIIEAALGTAHAEKLVDDLTLLSITVRIKG